MRLLHLELHHQLAVLRRLIQPTVGISSTLACQLGGALARPDLPGLEIRSLL